MTSGTTVESLKPNKDGVTATLKGGDGKTTEMDASHVILAIGITGNIENLGLEETGVKTDRGHIVILKSSMKAEWTISRVNFVTFVILLTACTNENTA